MDWSDNVSEKSLSSSPSSFFLPPLEFDFTTVTWLTSEGEGSYHTGGGDEGAFSFKLGVEGWGK